MRAPHLVALGGVSALLAGACASGGAPPASAPPVAPESSGDRASSEAAATPTVEEPMVVDPHGASTIPAPPDVAKAPDDAGSSPSGLRSKPLRPGKGGRRPRPNQHVRLHYTGWTTDGAMFDSSVARGEPIETRPDSLVPGLAEGLLTMTPGEQRRFWLPIALAYGGKSGRPFGNLTFDVELIAILPD